MKRKLLSVLLTLCLAFSLLPTAALAEGEGTLAPAATALPEAVEGVITLESKTYKLSENLTVTATIVVPSGVTATLDLGGKTLKRDSDTVLDIYGELTIKNGRIEKGAGGNAVAIWLNNAAKLTVESDAVVSVSENAEADCYCIAMWKDCTAANLTVKGTLKGGSGLTVNGLIVNTGNTVTIDGATIEAVNFGIYQAGVSETVIKDSNIKGSTAIEVRAGSMTIESGTFTATATEYKCDPNDNGATTEGAALAIAQHTTKKDISVTINGGTFTGIKALNESNPQNNVPTPQVTLNVKNGTFKGDVSITDGGHTFISGGAFTDLANAVKYAADNAIIKLAGDVTTNVTIPEGKTITLDLNGHTLVDSATAQDKAVAEASRKHTITNNGTLTIFDSVGTGVVDNLSHGRAAIYNAGTIAEIKSGKFTSSADASVSSEDDGGNSWYVMYNAEGATISKISGGEFLAIGKYSSLFCNCGSISEISGGTFTQDGFIAFKNTGTVDKISGGTFSSKKESCIQNWGSIGEITGGTITAGSIGIWNFSSDKYSSVGKVGKISGGNISGSTAAIRLNDYDTTYLGTPSTTYKASVAVSGGNISGNLQINTHTKFTVSGGYFTSDPTAYLAADKYVIKSDKTGYTYTVTGTKPSEAPVFVQENTEAKHGDSVSDDIKNQMTTEVLGKTEVNGVADAVNEDALLNKVKVDVTDNAVNKVDVEVKVDVQLTGGDLSDGAKDKTLTFKAEPVATVTVTKADGTTETKDNVKVPNAMLNGKPITVKLPLPAGFTPKQIKHTSSDGSVEYFLDTQKTGAKTFEIKDGCAVFTITKFSTFELSGTVTYVEPSYSSGGSSDPTYSVSTPSKTEHGTVTVSPKSASKGDTVTVTVKPDSGYVLETLTVTDKNGNELTLKDKGNGKYTFTMPAGKVEVKATFMEDNSMLNFFYDVPNNAYFYEAVKWAVENGITTGVGNDLFAPEQPCTRAQIVTFLWRAAGSPEPKGAASGMSDVVSGSYYEKAVAWAIENGITTGTTTSTFSPDVTCTRAQAVTFLARALKAKAASAAEFSDVPTGSYFADAVAWAAANGVTEGIGGGLFGSDNDCTRGQIVTFLYRAYNK